MTSRITLMILTFVLIGLNTSPALSEPGSSARAKPVATKEQAKVISSQPNRDILVVDYELPGLTKSAGYNYPDKDAGKELYQEEKNYYLFYPVARAQNAEWILIDSPRYDIPVWIPRSTIWLIGDNELKKLPLLSALPEIFIPPPAQNNSGETITGIVQKDLIEHAKHFPAGTVSLNGYSAPEHFRSARSVCKIVPGAVVQAIAALPNNDDVLVKTRACKNHVWIDPHQVEWDGLDSWKLRDHLPIIKPSLMREPTVPSIQRSPGMKRAQLPERKDGRALSIHVVNTRGDLHPWQKRLPTDWQVRNRDQADLVLTVRKAPCSVQKCNYIPWGAFMRVRLDYYITLTMKDPSMLLAETTIKGQEPPPCPDHMTQGDSPMEVGREPAIDDLLSWLTAFIKETQ